MSKLTSSRSVWNFIIKVIITVATAVGGLPYAHTGATRVTVGIASRVAKDVS